MLKEKAIEQSTARLLAFMRAIPEAEQRIPGLTTTMHRIVRTTYDTALPRWRASLMTQCAPVFAGRASLAEMHAIEAFITGPVGRKMNGAAAANPNTATFNAKAAAAVGTGRQAQITGNDLNAGSDPMAVLASLTPDEILIVRDFMTTPAGQQFAATAQPFNECVAREMNAANAAMSRELQVALTRELGPRIEQIEREENAKAAGTGRPAQ
jgi:hypothetical protein